MICILSQRHFERYKKRLALHNIDVCDDPSCCDIWLAEPALAAKALRQRHQPEWIASVYAGVDALIAADLPRNYQLTNIRQVFGPLMTQYVFAHLLSRMRHLPRYVEAQRQQLWQPKGYDSLANQTMVIVGTGNIGQQIATVATAFGMQVIGVNTDGRDISGFERCFATTQLHEAMSCADVVVSILPSTTHTTALFNQHSFATMQPHAGFINVGRGNSVDIDALITALTTQQLGFAVLDVFEQEPLPADSPLWHCPNLTITPHVAAASFPEQVVGQFVENLQRYQQQQPLQHLVDLNKGY
ncbi:D-2-hydroxyacid dehydrogenase [Ferrimonas lipolytica]|uniref:D-2-hydroxyacid dehydrogenase n=1 Tax=Ferrimonas lipolytica TaxID=2724191 RepID=A0A6H1UHT0_9GAMM|nr:D-2-hydroxyacid dehydrogenase [Ferrimonas lipolytica]QIZ78641.1 D-2-hydroxyacid dehydrogenase [Ferrimonas lipolytica]